MAKFTAASFKNVTLTLTATTGCTLTGTANISGLALNRPSANRMTGQWSFAFTEEPEVTWDETGTTGGDPDDIVGGTEGAVSATGMNGDIDGWAFNRNADEVTWRPFSQELKKRAIVAHEYTGQFTGTIQFNGANTTPGPTA